MLEQLQEFIFMFCFTSVGNVKDAAISAKTYLLFHPDDPTIMNANMKYYMKNQQVQESEIKPRDVSLLYYCFFF